MVLAGCNQALVPRTTAAPIASDSIAASIFLIGDSDDPNPAGEPVLQALSAALARHPERSLALFLGDNVYESGMPDSTAPDYLESRRRLVAAVEAVRTSGAQGIFIPGNHDWQLGRESVLREQAIIAQAGGGQVIQLPVNACPGPAMREFGPVTLILFDTEWWLRGTWDSTSTCNMSQSSVFDSLRTLLVGAAGRTTIVAGHHPVISGGEHNGYFSWKDYFFPLLHAKSWLWVPLPVIGAAYPIARNQGISPQDMSNGRYRRMIDSLNAAFAVAPPSVYASGHDHGLQAITTAPAGWQLISGAGYYHHLDFVGQTEGSRLALARSGFMRLDVSRDRRLLLTAITVDAKGKGSEVTSFWLDQP